MCVCVCVCVCVLCEGVRLHYRPKSYFKTSETSFSDTRVCVCVCVCIVCTVCIVCVHSEGRRESVRMTVAPQPQHRGKVGTSH